MTTVTKNGVTLDLRPFVVEAIEALRLVRPEAIDWLTAEIGRAQNRTLGRAIREASQDWHSALTDRGLEDPIASFDDTCQRALSNCRRRAEQISIEHLLDGSRSGSLWAGTRVKYLPHRACAAIKAREQSIDSQPITLPIAECTEQVCGCFYELLTKRRAAKEQV